MKPMISNLLFLTLLHAAPTFATPDSSEIREVRCTIAHQEKLLAATGAGSTPAQASTSLIQKALQSNRARLLELLSRGRLTSITALHLTPEELQRQLADEEKRTTLRDRAPAGPDIPCPPSAAPVLESGTRYAPAQAAGILAHESCPKTATEREAWLAKQIETSPKRRGIPVLYESPYLRIEWQGSALSVFSRDAAPGSSPRTSYAAATLLKERWLAGGEAPATHEPTTLPMTLQDRGDCVISQLAASGFLIPRDPTSDEAVLAARLAETQGVERNTDRTQPQVISPTDARKLEDLEFTGMFQIKSSSPARPLVGTWGLGPYVGVSLWNSRTKTASVVHLDPTQSVPDTLQEMLDSMGGRSSGIEARIIGGWTGFSERTLLHARSFMQERGIAILQEDTLGFEAAKGSRGFIVDSRTGRLFARVSASP